MKIIGILQPGARAEAWIPEALKRAQNLPLRILVADENPLIRQLNSEVLIDSGYQVDAAEDGASTWSALLVNHYDLLITDDDLPHVTGVNLLEKIHATRMAMPVIMTTGKMPAWKFAQYAGLQPAAILIKPYLLKELLETVNKILWAQKIAQAEIAPPSWHAKPPNGGLRTGNS